MFIPAPLEDAGFDQPKNSSTALHSIPIASYGSIMHLVAKLFSHVKNHASSLVTGIEPYPKLSL